VISEIVDPETETGVMIIDSGNMYSEKRDKNTKGNVKGELRN